MLKFLKKAFFKSAPESEAEIVSGSDISQDALSSPSETVAVNSAIRHPEPDVHIEPENTENKPSFLSKLKQGLQKTRQQFTDKLSNLFLGKKTIDQALFKELEEILLTADVGFEVTQQILKNLTQAVSRQSLKDPQQLLGALKIQLRDLLKVCEVPYQDTHSANPFVILMVGINGAGKTTTIGKMAQQFRQNGHKVMLAAGDTFRAAAVEQLKVWGIRNDIPVIHQETGADSASVIFDAFQAAKAREVDVLFADTAGRLHNKQNLMEELKKIIRVLKKNDPTAPHEVLLVLDATTGQNAIRQAQQFHESVGVTGLVITKLDGTAKAGAIFAIAAALKLPIRFIGVGEKIDDLKPFSAVDFVDALFQTREEKVEEPEAHE
jgi:fused signal recognition particle receptor